MNFLVAILLLTQGGTIETYQKKLKKLEKKLEITRKKLKGLKKSERNLKRELNLLESEEKIVEDMIEVLRKRERELLLDLEDLKKRKEKADSLIRSTKERIKEGLIFLYKAKKPRSYSFLFGLESEMANYESYKVVGTTLKEEENLFRKVLQAKKILENYENMRKKNLFELSVLKEDMRKRERQLKRIRQKKLKALKKIRAERAKKEKEIKRLKASIQKLEELIARLERERELERLRKGMKLGSIKGRKIIWPLKGKVVMHFGTIWHPKYLTRIKNNGIDIKGTPGAPVVSIDDGEVVYSAPFLGYDNLIIIDHNGFFSVYGNLGRIIKIKGDKVIKGAIIGYLKKDEPILHFELRIGGRAVDPLLYLP